MGRTTWDGLEIASEPPFGATIVVHRRAGEGTVEVLALRRRLAASDQADWAWGPPSGCRWPEEVIAETARRELAEETGIDAQPRFVSEGDGTWFAYAVAVAPEVVVTLSDEHERWEWLSPAAAIARVSPQVVRDQLRNVLRALTIPGIA